MQNNDFENNDDLNLFNTLIESVKITFNPKRNIEFSILKPDNENNAKYFKGSLKLINVFDSNMSFENNYDDYPEFYRSAIRNQSDYLIKTLLAPKNEEHFKKVNSKNLKHFYFLIYNGKRDHELNIVCENLETCFEEKSEFLTEIEGFNE